MEKKQEHTDQALLKSLDTLCTREIVPTAQSVFRTLLTKAFNAWDEEFEDYSTSARYTTTLKEVRSTRKVPMNTHLQMLYKQLQGEHFITLKNKRPPDTEVTLDTQRVRMQKAFKEIIKRKPDTEEQAVIDGIAEDNVRLLGPIRQACRAILKELPPDPPKVTAASS